MKLRPEAQSLKTTWSGYLASRESICVWRSGSCLREDTLAYMTFTAVFVAGTAGAESPTLEMS